MLVEDDLSVRHWLGRLGSSGSENLRVFSKFYDEVLLNHFAGKSPSEVVDWQIEHANDHKERFLIVELAQNWVNKQSLRYNTKVQMYSRIRSFFNHNRAELPKDDGFTFQSDIAPVQGKLTVDNLRSILLNCDAMYRAVYLLMFQLGLDETGFQHVNLNYGEELVEAVQKNLGVVKVFLPGRKRNRNRKSFYTVFLTKSDSADCLRAYLKATSLRSFNPLFLNKYGKPLSKRDLRWYFHWHAVKVGIIKQYTPSCKFCGGETVRMRRDYKGKKDQVGYQCKECPRVSWACEMDLKMSGVRYGVNPHEMRDLFRSRWRESGAESVVSEYVLGHEIDRNEYDKMEYTPQHAVNEFRKAIRYLNVLSETPEKVDRVSVDLELEGTKATVEALQKQLAMLMNERRETVARLKKIEEQLEG